jgi:hypothetical protein
VVTLPVRKDAQFTIGTDGGPGSMSLGEPVAQQVLEIQDRRRRHIAGMHMSVLE